MANAAGASVQNPHWTSWKLMENWHRQLEKQFNETVIPCMQPLQAGLFTFYITTQSMCSIGGNELHFTFVSLHVSREISTTDEDETLERKLSGDPGKLPEGLWVSLPQNWNIFPPTGALISESVKYSALLTHLSRADRVEEQRGRRGVESLISRESAGPNPWMNVVIITVSRSHMLTETLSFFHHSCLKWDREWDTAAEACKQNRSYQKHVIFKFNLLLNFMC